MTPSDFARSEQLRAAILRADFARDLGVKPSRWAGRSLSRFVRSTGERPARVAEIRGILDALGMHDSAHWPDQGGVFDHGEMWGRNGVCSVIVGHPYHVSDDGRELLAALARFPGLRVSVDDRPSYYGFGTHHVRIEVPEPRRPYSVPKSTSKTRAAARAFRRALGDELGVDSRGVPIIP